MAEKVACDDWVKDNAKGGAAMTYELFVNSMFELASARD